MAVEKINLDISKSEGYLKWLKTFHTQNYGKQIIHILDIFTQKDRIENRDWLKLHVLVTCFCVEKYNSEYDRGHQAREKEKDQKGEIKKQINAIKKTTKLVEKDPHSSINFIFACSNLNKPKEKYPKNQRPGKVTLKVPKDRRDTIFQEVLENYETQLNRELKYSTERFKKGLFTYGGLAFPQTNLTHQGKTEQPFKIRGIRKNSFFFHMTYIFRHYKANELNLGDSLNRMPNIGEPHYDLTELIYEQLFPNERNAKRAAQRMINHLVSSCAYIHPWHLPI